MSFYDQTIWITGASSGIGEALAYELSQQGAILILSARNIEQLQQVKSQCSNSPQHRVIPLDLTDTKSLESALIQVLGYAKKINILIHCGGVSQRSLVQNTDLAVDRQIMETNYFGTIALTKGILPSMLQHQSGQIVVISSVVGYFGTPLRSAYAASKHALHGFFDSLRAEVYDAGIRITIVCPGFIQTDISCHALTGKGKAYGNMDEGQSKGMDVGECAQKIVTAMKQQKAELLIGGTEVWGVYLKRFLPSLFNRVIRNRKAI